MTTECWRMDIRGRVQGVFFRAATQDQARALGVTGWVRNRHDGHVEVLAEGEPAQLQALKDWSLKGPRDAKVEDVRVREETPGENHDDFMIAPDT